MTETTLNIIVSHVVKNLLPDWEKRTNITLPIKAALIISRVIMKPIYTIWPKSKSKKNLTAAILLSSNSIKTLYVPL